MNQRLPWPLPQVWLICSKGSQNSGDHWLTRLLIPYRRITATARGRETQGESPNKGASFLVIRHTRALHRASRSMVHHCGSSRKRDKSSPFWIFLEASVHDWIIGQWQLMQPPAPLPSLEIRDWKFQPSGHMVGSLATSPLPWVEPWSHLLWSIHRNWGQETKYPIALITQEILRVWGALSQELWMKTKYIYFFYKWNYHIQ